MSIVSYYPGAINQILFEGGEHFGRIDNQGKGERCMSTTPITFKTDLKITPLPLQHAAIPLYGVNCEKHDPPPLKACSYLTALYEVNC